MQARRIVRPAALYLGGSLGAAFGAGYLAALLGGPGGARTARWLALAGTLVLATALLACLRVRIARLVHRLSEASRTDPLTGVLNRRGFDERMSAALARAARNGRPVSLLLGDLDEFKRLNDRCGHAAGDRALRRFASVAMACAKRTQIVGRFGGEEFAVLLPDTDAIAAYAFAERMRRAYRDASAGVDGATLSVGIASLPGAAAEPELLLRSADRALYAAKALGRDRSIVFERELDAVADQPAAISWVSWPRQSNSCSPFVPPPRTPRQAREGTTAQDARTAVIAALPPRVE